MSKTVKEILVAAKEIISTPDKWYKGNYRNYDEHDLHGEEWRYCMMGACKEAAGFYDEEDAGFDGGEYHEALGVLYSCVEAIYPEKSKGYIPTFNDNPDTTHEEVMTVFDCAIGKV